MSNQWYEGVDAATLVVWRTIPGMTVWDSEPANIGPTLLPGLFPIFDRGHWDESAGVTPAEYHTVYRLVIRAGDAAAAQSTIRPLVNTFHAALEPHRDLGGLGVAWVSDAIHRVVTVAARRYAVLDIEVTARQIGAIGSGI